MKIFIATYLNNDNYGSVLQAYALQCAIKKLGREPVTLQKSKQKQGIKRLVISLKRIIKPKKNYNFITRLKLTLFETRYRDKKKKLQFFINSNIKVFLFQKNENVISNINKNDILLAGSDQIWSSINGSLSDFYTFQWPHLPDNIKRYSYAASLGFLQLSENQKNSYRIKLDKFSEISVRESEAKFLLESIINRPVRIDIDPTLLFDASFWDTHTADKIVDEPYIFLYMLRPDEILIKKAIELAKKLKCRLFYTGLLAVNNEEMITVYDAGIEEFLSYIKFAKYVITNSFHGSVFSIIYKKQFISIKIDSTSSRVANLLSISDLNNRLINNNDDYYYTLNKPIDYERTFLLLEKQRKSSWEYLKNILDELLKLPEGR